MNFKKSLKQLIPTNVKSFLRAFFAFKFWFQFSYLNVYKKKKYGYLGNNVIIEAPVFFTDQSRVFLEDYSRIRYGFQLINHTGKFVLKKYSVIASNCVVVTGNHCPTVGVPQYVLGANHINDKEQDVVIEEDVWVGINCTILSGAHIGRRAVIGAGSLVNKSIPPYAVAVGSPAKIIASVFTLEEILKHEEQLYPESERFSKEYLEKLFDTYYKDKKSIGCSSMTDEQRHFVQERLSTMRTHI